MKLTHTDQCSPEVNGADLRRWASWTRWDSSWRMVGSGQKICKFLSRRVSRTVGWWYMGRNRSGGIGGTRKPARKSLGWWVSWKVVTWIQRKEEIQEQSLKNKGIWQHTRQKRGRRKSRELPRSLALRAWKAAGVSVRVEPWEGAEWKRGRQWWASYGH